MSGPRPANPVCLAHRGGGLEAPENTWLALQHTAALGQTIMETDVRLTRDRTIVLQHDANLDRTWNASGPISHISWKEMESLRGPKDSRPVRLADALEHYPSLQFNIDAKCDEVTIPLCEMIKKFGAEHRVRLASFSTKRLRIMRRFFSGSVSTSLSALETAGVAISSELTVSPAVLGVPGLRQGVEAVQVPQYYRGVQVVTPRFIAGAHAYGLQVHVWTVDDASIMTRLLDMGVNGIVTNRPSLFNEVLRLRKQGEEG